MSKRRRAGAGRRVAEQRFWGGPAGPTAGGQSAAGQVTADRSPAGAANGRAEGPEMGPGPGAGPNGSETVLEAGGPAADGPMAPAAPAAGSGAASGSAATGGSGATASPNPAQQIRPTTDPAAVVRSLGAPPFAIDASVAERHLTAVYEEAVRAATALAAANGLLVANEEDPDG